MLWKYKSWDQDDAFDRTLKEPEHQSGECGQDPPKGMWWMGEPSQNEERQHSPVSFQIPRYISSTVPVTWIAPNAALICCVLPFMGNKDTKLYKRQIPTMFKAQPFGYQCTEPCACTNKRYFLERALVSHFSLLESCYMLYDTEYTMCHM